MALSKSALRSTGSTRQWRNIRERILRRDGYICQYCGQEADTVDHVIPRRLGGNDSNDNLLSACYKCNLSKGGRFFVSKRTTQEDMVLCVKHYTITRVRDGVE